MLAPATESEKKKQRWVHRWELLLEKEGMMDESDRCVVTLRSLHSARNRAPLGEKEGRCFDHVKILPFHQQHVFFFRAYHVGAAL